MIVLEFRLVWGFCFLGVFLSLFVCLLDDLLELVSVAPRIE